MENTMTTTEKLAAFEKCFDDLLFEYKKYSFHHDLHPDLISLLVAVNDRILRLKVIKKLEK